MDLYEWLAGDMDPDEGRESVEYWLEPRNHRLLKQASGCSQEDINILVSEVEQEQLYREGLI